MLQRHLNCSIARRIFLCLTLQVLADVAAADAFAAKGASDIDAQQIQTKLQSLIADAINNSTTHSASSPSASAQQAMLRYTLARHGEQSLSCYCPLLSSCIHLAAVPSVPVCAGLHRQHLIDCLLDVGKHTIHPFV